MSSQQKFLSFNLGAKGIAVISLHDITEILQVSLTEICCIPQMPSSVLGIYNWRGDMLWLVDLEEMLGYVPLPKEANFLSKMMAIVVQNEGKSLGLLVRQIMDIECLDSNHLKPTNSELFSSEISHFLNGYFINDLEEMIINLNANAIIQSPMWSIHN
ncbi:MAG: purine-binding chemotaxis protein CheW [Chlorogloeopsis fritschii C42_A2020_084]|uniref:chemotaxis protein CheW n=1 Tax=Chlorogloeopsis fritschii TaxID=1124 RepID=UPI001A082E24|nr:chemotaxis protein CheW [Chlorogloeopsis fritschii]MBF2007728.1 purine-binding chemotaxis protein CheW [Chlorogloeopsis fritschii C42_A2020_084]